MKFTIRPIGTMGLVERGLAKVYRDNEEGGREEVNDYVNPLLPGGERTHRVFFDPIKRVYPIALTEKALNEVVKDLKFTDPKTGKLLTSADAHNELDPFFCLEELVLEVPNSGITLDDDDPIGKLWFAAAKAEPKIFNIDNNTENPAIKRVQEFKVTTSGFSEHESKEIIAEGKRATAIFHAKQLDYQWLLGICRGMDIIVADNAKIDALQDTVYQKITIDKDYKTRDGVRYIDRFLELNDMSQDAFESKARINKAIALGIIVKEGRRYSFEGQNLGTTPDTVFANLMKPENTDIKGYVLARLEERTSGK